MNDFIQIDGHVFDRKLVARIDPVDSHGQRWGFKIFFSAVSVPTLTILGDSVEFGKPGNRATVSRQRDALVAALGDVLLIQ